MVPITKADGSIIIDTKIDTGGFSKGATNLKTQFKGLSGAVAKLGIAIATAFSVREIVAFGKEAIKLGSDLQEVQNVVDVTFTTMSEQVNEFAKNAAKAAGLSETMAKRYVGTFGAMAKSFKFTESEAFTMSTTLTQLAGDVASFYNLTQGEAYTKLKSVFTGETESLKDLGVVMTQTALDDYALRKGLGKTTDQMSEQEKVALRYQFVLDQLSGASGDFARTSNSWANQTRLLTLQFDQLKATIGQGLINVLTPAVQMLNQLLEKLQSTADAFKSLTESVFGDASGSMQGSVEGAAGSAGDLEDNIKKAGKAAKNLISGFDELNIVEAAKNAENLETSIPGTNVDGSANNNEKANEPTWVEAVISRIREAVKVLQGISFSGLRTELDLLIQRFLSLGSLLDGVFRSAYEGVLAPLSTWVIEEAAPASVGLITSALESLSAAFENVKQPLQDLWNNALKPIFTKIGSWIVSIVNETKKSFDYLKEKFVEYKDEIAMVIESISVAIQIIWSIISPIIQSAVSGIGNVLKTTIDFIFALIQALGNAFGFVKNIFLSIVNLFKGNFDEAGKYAKQALSNFVNIFVGIANAIISVINNLWTLIFDSFKGTVNSIGGLVSKIGSWIGFDWDLQFSGNAPMIPTIPKYVPYLAQGAVIPPRAPFMAVLGDQRNGTNIEAPLATIEEAVARVTGGQSDRMIDALYALIGVAERIEQKDLNVQIGDDEIGRANTRYKQTRGIQVNAGAFADAY